jgi:hypothetical protein
MTKTEQIEIESQQAVIALSSGQCFVGAAGQFSLGVNT